ncbi:hypothetical protein [uncultured Leuconostoc sp.]|uniref:hypothetical protein n=1 Tax=uncultured Leuconostoc sp. TaxID=173262 RepID=UPI0025E13AAF|nr:hypothetical protein [uncultured Leuconostoc sp.]
MAQTRLDFLVFYRGNLVSGFDYVYIKRHEGHAFWHSRDKAQEAKDITDIDFDFYNPHFNQAGQAFNWRYREQWSDMTTSWDDFTDKAMRYINTWMTAYPGPSQTEPSLNDEWGIRFKVPSENERMIWGLNAYPANLQSFIDFLYTFAN